MIDENKMIAEITAKLPQELVASATKTLIVISLEHRFNVLEEAMYWNTVNLAFQHGCGAGLEKARESSADIFSKLTKGGN